MVVNTIQQFIHLRLKKVAKSCYFPPQSLQVLVLRMNLLLCRSNRSFQENICPKHLLYCQWQNFICTVIQKTTGSFGTKIPNFSMKQLHFSNEGKDKLNKSHHRNILIIICLLLKAHNSSQIPSPITHTNILGTSN